MRGSFSDLKQRLKETVRKARREFLEGLEESQYCSTHTIEDAETVAAELEHSVEPERLRRKMPNDGCVLCFLHSEEHPKYLIPSMELKIDDEEVSAHSQLLVTQSRIIIPSHSFAVERSLTSIVHEDIIGVTISEGFSEGITIRTSGHTYEIITRQKADLLKDVMHFLQNT